MEPPHCYPPLHYDRYMNRMLPYLPHSAPAPSIPPTYFEEPQQGSVPPDFPPRSPPVPMKMMADPFVPQFEPPNCWMGPEQDSGFPGMSPPDCDPRMAGVMMPPMMHRPVDEGFNGGYYPGGEVLYDDPYRPRMGPATLRAWNMARLRNARLRKSCWDSCRPCQYIGVFVFLCVLAVIGYAVYNGGKYTKCV